MQASMAGDLHALMSPSAEDVTASSDSGGKVAAAVRQPIHGRDQVARAIFGFLSPVPEGTTFEVAEVNSLPALLIYIKGQIVSVISLEVEGNFIHAARNVANPDKLARLN